MKAIWLEEQNLSFRDDIPIPRPGKGQALIQVDLAGVCSTDIELARGYYPFTGIPGHEFFGKVVDSPDDHSWVGKQVVGEINIYCGICLTCKSGLFRHCEDRKTLGIHAWNGAFAEYLVLPLENLHIVPDGVSGESAVFTEPLAAAYEIMEQTDISPGDHVLLIGAGRLGQLIASVIHLSGCELEVVTRHPRQQELIKLLNVPYIDECSILGKKYDIVIEATGTPSGFNLALEGVRPRGRIVLKSTYKGNIEVNFSRIVVDEITLIGSRCGSFVPALRLLAERKVDPCRLIDATYPLEQGITALEHASRPGALKVLIQPGAA
jgi:threonine dehydrogenase-like Zn-dependent dehydrogenase